MSDRDIDPVLWNDWHAVAELETLRLRCPFSTTLLGAPLLVTKRDAGAEVTFASGKSVLSKLRYGFVWACLGVPEREIVAVPEYAETARCITTGGSFAVHVSAPRVVENFLDLGHLGYVHAGYLGAEPETAVASYEVHSLPEGGIIATGCKIYQPFSSPAANGGYVVDYSYKVVRPLTVALFKANPIQRDRFDAIYLFVQPVDEEHCIAHALILFGEDGTTAADLRWFQQLIFLQDKPILENQNPKRLPIGPQMEMPIAADKSSVAYRRWLMKIGLRYGTIGGQEPLAA